MSGKLNYTSEFCKYQLTVAKKLQKVMEKIIAGYPMTQACRDNDIDYSTYRKFLVTNFDIKKRKNLPKLNPKDLMTWEDKLIHDIFGDDHYVLPDFQKAYEITTASLSDRERETLRLVYEEGLTLEDVGKTYGVTRERVRQLVVMALRKLRHPSRAKYFLYGADTEIITKYEKKVHELVNERLSLLNSLKEKVSALESSISDLKSQCNVAIPKDAQLCIETIDCLGLSNRSYNALYRNGIQTVKDLTKYSTHDLLHLRHLGKQSCEEICKALFTKYGIELKGEL